MMTERWEFLYIRRQHIEVYSEAWQLYTAYEAEVASKHAGSADATPGSGQGRGGEVDTGAGQKNKKRKSAGASSITQPKPSTGEQEPKKKKVEKSELDKKLALAMKTAGDYQVMKSSATELLQAIDSTAAWDWARNEGNRGVLKSTVEALTAGVTEELRVVLIHTAAELKRDMGADSLLVLATTFCDTMIPLIKEVRDCKATLMRRLVA